MSLPDDIELLRRDAQIYLPGKAIMALERLIEAAQLAEKETGTVYTEINERGLQPVHAVLSFMAGWNKDAEPSPHFVLWHSHDGVSRHYIVRSEAQLKSNPRA